MAKKPSKIKGIIEEFKKFVTRGNVVDLAVGVIIGGAFTGIVNALSNNILKPLINWVLSLILGDKGLSSAITILGAPVYLEDGVTIDLANTIHIDWGAFISAILNFFIVAIVLFIIVKTINTVRDNSEKLVSTSKEKARQHKLEKLLKKNEKLKAKGKKEIEIPKELLPPAPVVPEPPAPAPVDPQIELLKEIRDLLKENKK